MKVIYNKISPDVKRKESNKADILITRDILHKLKTIFEDMYLIESLLEKEERNNEGLETKR